jgi:hypothetical protein
LGIGEVQSIGVRDSNQRPGQGATTP